MSVFTSKHIVALCDKLNELFGNGYEFVPEPIDEGGIVLADRDMWSKTYKSIRFQGERYRLKWPLIEHGKQLELWRKGEAVTLLDKLDGKTMKIGMNCLKAFHGAPCWTVDELKLFVKAWESIGFSLKGKLPSARSLVEYGGAEDLGGPQG